MGISRTDLIQGRATARIAALASADVTALERVTFVKEDRKRVRLGSQVLKADDWSFGSLRVCPQCLREDLDARRGHPDYRAHVRSWWNLAFIYACPFHSVSLITRDPANDEKSLNPEALDVRFAAGQEYDLAVFPVAERRVSDVRLETYILGRLGFMPPSNNGTLDSLSLADAIQLLDHIGVAAIGGAYAHTSGGTVSSREALVAGYTIIKEGRPALVRLFENLKTQAGAAENQWIPRANYGRLYAWLFHVSTRDIAAYDPIRRLMLECIGSPTSQEMFAPQREPTKGLTGDVSRPHVTGGEEEGTQDPARRKA
jgi:hypothetical protein